ncbi:MAG: General transcription factor IIIC, polypeptide 3, partial [Paramarteilia canceri]
KKRYLSALKGLKEVLKLPQNQNREIRPYLYFCTAMIYLNITRNKRIIISRAEHLLSGALVFLKEKYATSRGSMFYQEINFNLGRYFHSINDFGMAEFYYNKAIESSPFKNMKKFCLRKKAAYNLIQIYQTIECYDAAKL